MAKWPDHTPLRGGGCLELVACECDRAEGRHCASCGVAIYTEPGRHPGSSHTGHVGARERLWALEAERRASQ